MGEQVNELQSAPVAAEEEGDRTVAGAQSNTTPRAQKTRRRTKERTADSRLEEEADLPATPSQKATEEQYTTRPGLFSSPSKRPPRLNDPMKKTRSARETLSIQQDGSDVPVDGPMKNAENEHQQPQKDKRLPPDPEIEEKKREKVRLEKELRLLEKQVSKCTEEIAKSQVRPATHVGSPEEREALVKLINELVKTGEEDQEESSPPLSSMLCSFLPFVTQQIASPKAQPGGPVASHRPLELDDPLPYLQMFTSFDFSTKLSLTRGQSPLSSNQVHQKHVIDLTGPQSLLTASVSATIDTISNAIIDLKLLQLPHWADRELGSFIRARAQEQDLGNACWAIGSYWDIAKKRAEYWHRCEVAFGHLIPGRTSEDIENLDERNVGKSRHPLSRRDLNRHLGRETLVLEDRYVLLKITWKIGFDWTGEVESEVGVVPAVPRVWREADSNDSFKKIPATFTSLLQSKGAFLATKTMVALLFSER
ncbi:uncharacterized protein N0V89_008892 [Didymosphaeria variabile]|uniref:Uncharacterized protein n=1 Tax=Didymosphaeria variabile TaxID=1932322 RepID=A0A9W9C8Z0_9PLEO|nr:uncharacterized protein N0V89_008892 [Didymosphaeria variabile]KAJ4350271.1 hypothetical protein N0V89_008892 [Didymosphaeria variabile]